MFAVLSGSLVRRMNNCVWCNENLTSSKCCHTSATQRQRLHINGIAIAAHYCCLVRQSSSSNESAFCFVFCWVSFRLSANDSSFLSLYSCSTLSLFVGTNKLLSLLHCLIMPTASSNLTYHLRKALFSCNWFFTATCVRYNSTHLFITNCTRHSSQRVMDIIYLPPFASLLPCGLRNCDGVRHWGEVAS